MNMFLIRGSLVLFIVGLFLAVSIVPVSGIDVKELISESTESIIDTIEDPSSFHNMPEDAHNPDLGEGLLDSYDDFYRELDERHPYHYRRHLWNHSDYPNDEPFSHYPDYDEFQDIYVQRFDDEYMRNHTHKNTKPTPKPNFAAGKTWYVDDDGGADFTKIQDAIDAASDGDTVFVYSGIYYENVKVDKSIILQGEDRDNTIIDGDGGHVAVVTLSANWINISGFTIQNGGDGIYIRGYSNNSISWNNITENNNYGIYIWDSSNNRISGNNITGSNFAGIGIWHSSTNNFVSGNNMSNNYCGIGIYDSSNNVISGNSIGKSWDGIDIGYSSNNSISGNNISSNDHGIFLRESSSFMISHNNFLSSGIIIAASSFSFWNTHIIENNKVNGKPIYYYKNNHTDVIVPPNAGQVILANCSHFTIEHLTVNDVDTGIQIGFSSNINVSSSNINNNSYTGITILVSFDIKIAGNNILNVPSGIFLVNSVGISITGNNISKNYYGIYPSGSSDISITGNNISNNVNGIYLENSLKNAIEGNYICKNNFRGIYLGCSPNNAIARNTISKNKYGIFLLRSSAITITSNTINKNSMSGVIISSSSSVMISHNNFLSSGIIIGGLLSTWNTHTIENNKVNGKPIYYYKNNHTDVIVPPNAGQVILANCSHFTIEHLTVNDVDTGIQIGFSSNINVSSSNISNNINGIYLRESSNITITENIINNNDYGFNLVYLANSTIIGNNISKNDVGASLWYSSNNTFFGNNINNNEGGICMIILSDNNTVIGNNISNNSDGVSLGYKSDNNTIICNNISNNEQGIQLYDSSGNQIIDNLCISNFLNGIAIRSSSDNLISNCTICKNFQRGIVVENSTNNKISNCLIQDHNWDSGILLEYSDGTVIRNCHISNCMRGGIKINSPSSHTLISRCLLSGNSWGIDLTTSESNRIEECTIANNIYGGILEGQNNTICRNNFINNYNHYYHGEWDDTNVFYRNYWSGRLFQLPIPYRIFNLNFDWFPKAIPYDYPTYDETLMNDSDSTFLKRDFNEQNYRFTLIDKPPERLSSLLPKVRNALS